MLAVTLAGNLFAADVNASFSMANKLYAEGKFSEAANLYEKILQTDGQSPALLFNYANAEYKSGHVGKSIAAYQQALQFAPRNDDIRANLQFVRNQVRGASVHESRWRSWMDALTLNEGTLLTAVFFWLLFALLIARQIRPALASKLRGLTRLAVVLAIFSGGVLALQAAEHFSNRTAVVVEKEAIVRSGPFHDAQKVFIARDGVELTVMDHHDDWLQVADGMGKIGWLNKKQVEVLPGA